MTITVNSNACKVYGNLCLQFLPGDLNRDGKVDLADLYLFAGQWTDGKGFKSLGKMSNSVESVQGTFDGNNKEII
jgi:hypothetical protein